MGRIEDDFTAFGRAMRDFDQLDRYLGGARATDSIAKAALQDSAASAMAKLDELSVARRLAEDSIAKAVLQDNVASAMTKLDELSVARRLAEDSIAKAVLQDNVASAMTKFDELSIAKSLTGDSIASARAAADARFVLPLQEQLAALASDLYGPSRSADTRLQFLSAAESLKSPWMDAGHPLESAQGLAALVEINSALKGNPFDTLASETLRNVLGDWREMPGLSEQMLADVGKRRSFYYENGLAPGVAALPRSAFGGIIRSAQASPPPPIAPEPASDPGDKTEEAASTPDPVTVAQSQEAKVAEVVGTDRPSREMVACYEIFHMLERKLRRLVESALESVAGPDWSKQRVPADVLIQWRERKKKAEDVGETGKRIIEFAEMGDYPKIICRKDNWKLFEPTFQRSELLREAFNRLIPLRHAIAHHRELSNEDVLFLWVEAWRLCKAMGSPSAEFPSLPVLSGAGSAN